MDENRYEGAAREAMGNVQDKIGSFVGDTRTQMQGKLNETLGSMQNQYGQAMETVQQTAKRVSERTRERPIAAVLIAAGVGYLIGRLGRWI